MDISSVTTPLAELQRRLSVIRDRVQGVALGYHTGFYLFGRPGTSKTFTVRSTLDDLGTKYAYHSGYLTPFGLLDLLRENHDRIVLLDDVASIFDQKPALQLLLAALGNQSTNREVRLVKYKQKNYEEEVRFNGGIIALSNLRLHSKPILAALKSRVNYLKYEPSDDQIEALMWHVASQEWTAPSGSMTSQECGEVADFLIAESYRLSVRLDMRNLVDKAFPDFLQHRNGLSETHWKDLIRSTLEEQLVELQDTPDEKTRASTKQREQSIARSIHDECSDRESRVARWKEVTGKSERAYYRRLKEIGLSL